jgi:hypothetical protein
LHVDCRQHAEALRLEGFGGCFHRRVTPSEASVSVRPNRPQPSSVFDEQRFRSMIG